MVKIWALRLWPPDTMPCHISLSFLVVVFTQGPTGMVGTCAVLTTLWSGVDGQGFWVLLAHEQACSSRTRTGRPSCSPITTLKLFINHCIQGRSFCHTFAGISFYL